MKTIVVGTRQSALAMTQTNQVVEQLKQLADQHGISCNFEIRKIVTKGDRILDVTLNKVGGKGLFVKEIEQAMLNGEIDMAVHSMKDMPWLMPPGLTIGAIPKREDPRDCLISNEGTGFSDLPPGARIGTSSLRRSSQLKHRRPDLRIEWIRGNIDSRIKKLEANEYDAIILASAGLRRMGWGDRMTEALPTDLCIPAVGQGALCIQRREEDAFMADLLGKINDEVTAITVTAERSFLGKLNGGCQIPIGAYATMKDDEETSVIELTGMVGSPDGDELIRETMQGTDPVILGEQLAQKLIDQGAEQILLELRG